MQLDRETLRECLDLYNSAPRAYIDPEFAPERGSFSLFDHLEYTPSERDQGDCDNCWVWASTGVLGIALDVQEGIKDRLSVQYFTSSWHGGTANDWAGCGGNIFWFADWYQDKGFAIPWSNTNAYWQDGDRTCENGTSVPADTISTTPNYPLSRCTAKTVETHDVGQAQAIDNIKNVLNQDKAVSFSFWLPNSAYWKEFGDFWIIEPESVIWNPDYSCGHTWVEDEGGGHMVLCVGYDDTDPDDSYWIMVNSWGTTSGRPNGVFRVDMNMNYDCTLDFDGTDDYNLEWATLDVGFVHREELHYDDGAPEQGWYWKVSGRMFAVVFTPRVAGQLTECSFCVWSDPARVKVHVMDEHRKNVITPFSVTPTSTGWFHIDLSRCEVTVSSGVDFGIAIEWTVANEPLLGDDTSDPDGRSWDYYGEEWLQYTDGDYLIRAVVETEAADMIVSDVSWSPTDPVEGDTVTFTVYIRNQGAGNAGSFKVACYVDDVKEGEWSIYSLSAGQTTSKTFTWTAVEGTHTVKAFADLNGVIAEIVKTNNKREETFEVEPKPKPDLIVSNISWTPEKPLEDETVTFTVTIRNRGGADSGRFKVTYYLDDVKKGEWTIYSLKAEATTTKTFTWTAVDGSHTVKVFADSDDDVEEEDETNNEREAIVGNLPPVASFCCYNGYNYLNNSVIFMCGCTCFNASESYDPEGSIVSYSWNFGDGNITAVTSPIIHHNHTDVGTYSVTLNVTDNQGLWSTVIVNVEVVLLGDLDGDRLVNIQDIAIVAKAYTLRLGDQDWNEIADLDNNGEINIQDIAIVAREYGKNA